jgi:hypothetical protein
VKTFILCLSLFLSLNVQAGDDLDVQKLSGVPRMVKENPVPQVIFNELSGTYLIPEDTNYSRVYNAFVAAQRSKKPISFTYNKRTKQITSAEGAAPRGEEPPIYDFSYLDKEKEEKAKQEAQHPPDPTANQTKDMADILKNIDSQLPPPKK